MGKVKFENFEKKVLVAQIATLRNSLETIVKMDYKKSVGVGNGEQPDFELITRMAKAQARLALDLVENMKIKKEDGSG